MSESISIYLDGVAFWAPTLPRWNVARAAFRGEGSPAGVPSQKPSARMLAPMERRRAPDSVALALEVAQAAVEASGHLAEDLPCVFGTTHGDFAVFDCMCRALTGTPPLVSPTKFHNSVLNAAVGYWTIATGCQQATTTISAFDHTFATALLEAAVQCAANQQAVLLVVFDVEAVAPLDQLHTSQGLLAAGMVLAPQRSERTTAVIDWRVLAGRCEAMSPGSEAARALPPNGMSGMLPLLETLARLPDQACDASLQMPLGASLSLALQLRA